VKFRFERRDTSLGPIESVLGRVRRRDADFRQVGRLLDELFDGSFVDLAE
jgi:hypothetical protein